MTYCSWDLVSVYLFFFEFGFWSCDQKICVFLCRFLIFELPWPSWSFHLKMESSTCRNFPFDKQSLPIDFVMPAEKAKRRVVTMSRWRCPFSTDMWEKKNHVQSCETFSSTTNITSDTDHFFFSSDVSGRPFSFSVFLFFGRKKTRRSAEIPIPGQSEGFHFPQLRTGTLGQEPGWMDSEGPLTLFSGSKTVEIFTEKLEMNLFRRKHDQKAVLFVFKFHFLFFPQMSCEQKRNLESWIIICNRLVPGDVHQMRLPWRNEPSCNVCAGGAFSPSICLDCCGWLMTISKHFCLFVVKFWYAPFFLFQMSSWFVNDTYEIQMSSFFG